MAGVAWWCWVLWSQWLRPWCRNIGKVGEDGRATRLEDGKGLMAADVTATRDISMRGELSLYHKCAFSSRYWKYNLNWQ